MPTPDELPKVKDIVAGNTVYFDRFRSGVFYYRVDVFNVTYGYSETFEFPVPLSDGSGHQSDQTQFSLLARDKAIFFMRYINAAIRRGEFVKVTQPQRKEAQR